MIVLVKVPEGEIEADGIKIPLNVVPAVDIPPFELVILLKERLNPVELRTTIPLTVKSTFKNPEKVPVVPKLEMVLPVPDAVPPISIPVLKLAAPVAPIIRIPWLILLMVLPYTFRPLLLPAGEEAVALTVIEPAACEELL